MLEKVIESLNLPKNTIIFTHVRLKGLSEGRSYSNLEKDLLECLEKYYNPKTILVPTFTYSFI